MCDGIDIICRTPNHCVHVSGVEHNPNIISCSVAEMKAYEKEKKNGRTSLENY